MFTMKKEVNTTNTTTMDTMEETTVQNLIQDSETETYEMDTPNNDYMDEMDKLLSRDDVIAYEANGTTVIHSVNEIGTVTQEYRIIPQNGTVKAKLGEHAIDAVSVVAKLVNNNSLYLSLNDDGVYAMLMNPTYSATAKCNEEYDTFDAMEGIKIAKRKAKCKYYSAMDKKLKMFLKDVRKLVVATEHYLDVREVDYLDVPTEADLYDANFGE